MAVLDGVHNLDHDLTCVLLCQPALLLHVLHQFAAPCQLHYHYELLALYEGVIQLHDILMSKLLDTIRLLVDSIYSIGASH